MGFFKDFAIGAAQTASDISIDKVKNAEAADRARQEVVLKTNAEKELYDYKAKNEALVKKQEEDAKWRRYLEMTNPTSPEATSNETAPSVVTPKATITSTPETLQDSSVTNLRNAGAAKLVGMDDIANYNKFNSDADKLQADNILNQNKLNKEQARENLLDANRINFMDKLTKDETERLNNRSKTKYLPKPQSYGPALTDAASTLERESSKIAIDVSKILAFANIDDETNVSSMSLAELDGLSQEMLIQRNSLLDPIVPEKAKQSIRNILKQNMLEGVAGDEDAYSQIYSRLFSTEELEDLAGINSADAELESNITQVDIEEVVPKKIQKRIKLDANGNIIE